MSLSEAAVQGALRQLVDPNTGKDFVSTRSARNIKVAGEDVSLDTELHVIPPGTGLEVRGKSILPRERGRREVVPKPGVTRL